MDLDTMTHSDWTAIVSAIIASCALALTVFQAISSRTHNRISVRPAFCDWTHISNNSLSFSIVNKGLGTAKIKSFNIFYKDKKFSHTELQCKLKELFPDSIDSHTSELTPYSYVAKDEKILVLFIQFENPERIDAVEKVIGDCFSLKIVYSCLYGEELIYESGV